MGRSSGRGAAAGQQRGIRYCQGVRRIFLLANAGGQPSRRGATAGSIRPIVLTYAATKPMIPIKLTAVAANDDMGVLTWVLGDHQAVPQNYYALELNEARIN